MIRKLKILILTCATGIFSYGYTYTPKQLKAFKLEATIKTTKGDINLYLYPDQAPITVANFVFLVKNNFYDNIRFHRVVPFALIQAGSRTDDGNGNSGYSIVDEFDGRLKYNIPGIIGMANTGQKNSQSSQFFITMLPFNEFNGHYTAFGNLKSKDDLAVVRTINENDYINTIEITGENVNKFLDGSSDEVKEWKLKLKK